MWRVFRPAFADIRAGGFFTNRCQVQVAHDFMRFVILLGNGCLDADPGGFLWIGLSGRLRFPDGGVPVRDAVFLLSLP